MKRLAIIPARGGSKRIPHKNIKDFCGMPMITHVLKAAEDSSLFDTIHVSSNDKKITEIITQHGFPPDFPRTEELADDHTPIMEVLKYVVDTYDTLGKHFDTIALLYATSPLLDFKDLRHACALFEQGNQQKAVQAVCSFPAPIERSFRMDADNNLAPVNKAGMAERSQDLPLAYHDAGMFSFYAPWHIQNSTGAGDYTIFKGYPVAPYRVTDIDWPEDWEQAEILFNAVNVVKKR